MKTKGVTWWISRFGELKWLKGLEGLVEGNHFVFSSSGSAVLAKSHKGPVGGLRLPLGCLPRSVLRADPELMALGGLWLGFWPETSFGESQDHLC